MVVGADALRIFAVAAALLIVTPAAAEQVFFRGTLNFTSTSNCAYQTVGSHYGSMYAPRLIGDNGEHAVITLFSDLNAAALDLADYEFSKTLRTVTVTGIGAAAYTSTAKVSVYSRSPATMTTATRFVLLKGYIQSPWDDPGINGVKCKIGFEAAYTRN